MLTRGCWLSLGSPPLVRERLFAILLIIIKLGITPARAGKTFLYAFIRKEMRDHPRSCGKDLSLTLTWLLLLGSPPLVRERHTRRNLCIVGLGITPARAGKTVRRPGRPAKRRDHPRSCGKDGSRSSSVRPRKGSPPLVRERQLQLTNLNREVGITPARAGKTTLCH